MAGIGPAGNPNAIRRNARTGVIVLPGEGRQGDAPRWPLPANPRLTARIEMLEDAITDLEESELVKGTLTRTEQTKLTRTRERLHVAEVEKRVTEETEVALWEELWHTPQAVEWDRLRWTHDVALYVRWMAAAQCGDLAAGKESRQYADRLGLTPRGLKSLMWTIAVDQVGEKREAMAATGTEGSGTEGSGTEGGTGRRRLYAVDGKGASSQPAAEASAKKAPTRKRNPAKKAAAKRPAKKTVAKKTVARKSSTRRTR